MQRDFSGPLVTEGFMCRDQPRNTVSVLPLFTAVAWGFVMGLEGSIGGALGHGGHGKPRSFQ
jgi:hypothetical protein